MDNLQSRLASMSSSELTVALAAIPLSTLYPPAIARSLRTAFADCQLGHTTTDYMLKEIDRLTLEAHKMGLARHPTDVSV